MKHMLEKLMEMKKGKKPLSENEKKAKMSAVKDLSSIAKEAMSDGMKGLKKVTVASNDEEGLKSGLEKAKELLGDKDEATEDAEEVVGADLDGDAEEGESEEHKEAVLGEEKEPSEMSPEELDAKIKELMTIKKMKEMKV